MIREILIIQKVSLVDLSKVYSGIYSDITEDHSLKIVGQLNGRDIEVFILKESLDRLSAFLHANYEE